MKQEDRDYEEWLAAVKSRQPVLNNPDELTAAILQRVARTPSRKKRRRFVISSWVSGIAAALLLCLMVSETLLTPPSYGVEPEEHAYLQPRIAPAPPEGWEKMTLSEKSDYLSDRYLQLKKQKQGRMMRLTKKTN